MTPKLVEWLEQQDEEEQSTWLFLEQSEEFRGCWQVDCLWPEFFIDFEPLIGNYKLVTPLGLDEFLECAREYEYHVVFVDDPITIIDEYEKLQKPPTVNLNSTLENVCNGFLPWQVVGFNKLVKADLPGGYFVWTTGAGKTTMIAAALKYHSFDLAMVVVKAHNKVDTQRKLKSLADIDSVIIDGPLNRRFDIYESIEVYLTQMYQLVNRPPVVVITNYEKLRDDCDVFKTLFKHRDLLIFWDEMAAKLSNPDTQLYKGVKNALYESFISKPRFKSVRHWALSATPIENSPDDIWGCINLMHPGLLGTRNQFRTNYVSGYNMFGEPKYWKNLDKLEAKVEHMVHRVSEDDPEVEKMFPNVMPPDPRVIIDWSPQHRALYDQLSGNAIEVIEELDEAHILAMIQIMQMVCDAPSMIKTSAQHREKFYKLIEELGEEHVPDHMIKGSEIAMILLEHVNSKLLSDAGHTKLGTMRELITVKHPNDKIVVHSTWADYIFPVWSYWLGEWGVSHVVYRGTTKQKQVALDEFRDNPDIRVFLSGDAGADSIDITEARVGINYNVPWKWTTLIQREGRRHRVTSGFGTIYTYTLMMPDSVDERKLEVCQRKKGYHESVFDGRATEEAMSASLTRAELTYIITGATPGRGDSDALP